MNIIKVTTSHPEIVREIISSHIDPSDRKGTIPDLGHLETLLKDDKTYLLAAMEGKEVFGYDLAYRFPSLYESGYLAYLYDIEVKALHRRKGIGKALVQTMLELLKRDKVKEVWLGTGVDNPEGQGLFSATGALKSEETFNDYTYYL